MLNGTRQTNYAQYAKVALSFVFTTTGFMLMKSTGIFWPLGAQAAETDAFEDIGHHLERRDALEVQTESPLLEQQNDLLSLTTLWGSIHIPRKCSQA